MPSKAPQCSRDFWRVVAPIVTKPAIYLLSSIMVLWQDKTHASSASQWGCTLPRESRHDGRRPASHKLHRSHRAAWRAITSDDGCRDPFRSQKGLVRTDSKRSGNSLFQRAVHCSCRRPGCIHAAYCTTVWRGWLPPPQPHADRLLLQQRSCCATGRQLSIHLGKLLLFIYLSAPAQLSAR